MTVIAYSDPDVGTRCVTCELRVRGIEHPVTGAMSMPDSLVTADGYAIYQITEDDEWGGGTAYRAVLWCDDCGCEIAESPENYDYCSCNDGCEAGECDNCEPPEPDDDDDGENERGCRCDGCKAMCEWVPGDPEPLEEEEPVAEGPPVRDGNPVPLPDPTEEFRQAPLLAAEDWFYDPSIPPGVQYAPAPGATWEVAPHYECASRSRPLGVTYSQWYCERTRGHALPHGAFMTLYWGEEQRCWN